MLLSRVSMVPLFIIVRNDGRPVQNNKVLKGAPCQFLLLTKSLITRRKADFSPFRVGRSRYSEAQAELSCDLRHASSGEQAQT